MGQTYWLEAIFSEFFNPYDMICLFPWHKSNINKQLHAGYTGYRAILYWFALILQNEHAVVNGDSS